MPRQDLTGQVHGRLTVLREGELRIRKNGRRDRRWVCRCACGREVLVDHSNLGRGNSLSCGCLRSELTSDRCTAHGHSANGLRREGKPTPEYSTWATMHARCTNPKNANYQYYGARGITVCESWSGVGGFARFLKHVGLRPSAKHSIDRMDVNGNYEPGNVRWATVLEQRHNRRH